MEQPIPTTPPPTANPAPTPQQAPAPQVVVVQAKGTPAWVWLLGGCLGLIILSMVAIGGLTWWAAWKVKQEYKKAQPQLEQWKEGAEKMSKEADEWQKESDKWQAEAEKIRNQIPDEIPME